MRISTTSLCSSRNLLRVRCICSAARTARSASSSWATGAPKSATSASPTILSTRPPKADTSDESAAKQRSTRFLTVSGSAVSEKFVNPTRSANSTVVTRRSSGRVDQRVPARGAEAGVGGRRAPARRALHEAKITGDQAGGCPASCERARPATGPATRPDPAGSIGPARGPGVGPALAHTPRGVDNGGRGPTQRRRRRATASRHCPAGPATATRS